MKVKVEIFGFLEEQIPHSFEALRTEFSLEGPVSLHYLLTEILKIRDTDKVVLANGKYISPNDNLHDGDLIQIFPRLDGG